MRKNYITQNFYKQEFEISQTATRNGFSNAVPDLLAANLDRTANFLQELRDKLKKHYGMTIPIVISSGYRCPKLNKIVGGSKNSAHCQALAADITAIGLTSYELFTFIRNYMEGYDQCILEFDRWVHLSVSNRGDTGRHENLIANKVPRPIGKPKTVYRRV